jgi:hypothetical protein
MGSRWRRLCTSCIFPGKQCASSSAATKVSSRLVPLASISAKSLALTVPFQMCPCRRLLRPIRLQVIETNCHKSSHRQTLAFRWYRLRRRPLTRPRRAILIGMPNINDARCLVLAHYPWYIQMIRGHDSHCPLRLHLRGIDRSRKAAWITIRALLTTPLQCTLEHGVQCPMNKAFHRRP